MLVMEERIFSGKYRILGEIASGGMGMVYHAIDLSLRREVAIKVLHKKYGGDPSFDQRFLQEARGLARLDHPNIVRIYAVEQEEGGHYIVMEYFPAQDLKHLLREHRPLPLRKALHIASEITKGLAYAHQKNIVHRDIKPGNILVDDQDNIKITDFGIVAVLDEPGVTAAGTVMGTPEYMSPEQAKGERVDAGSDLYSLGIVFYEMLTGKTPYEGLTGASIVGKLAHDQAELGLVFPSSIPLSLQYLIRGLTRKESEGRPKDAALVLETLKDHQEKLKSSSPTELEDVPTMVLSPLSKAAPTTPGKTPSAPKDKIETPSLPQPAKSGRPPPKQADHLPKRPFPIRALVFGLTGSLILVGLMVLGLNRWPLIGERTGEDVEPPRQEAKERPQTVKGVMQALEGLQRDYTNDLARQNTTRQTLLGQTNTLLANIHTIDPSLDIERSQQQIKAAEQRLADLEHQIGEEHTRQQSSSALRSQRVGATLTEAAQISKLKLTDTQHRSLQEIQAAIKAAQQRLNEQQTSFNQESTQKFSALKAALNRKKESLAKAVGQAREREQPLIVSQRTKLEKILYNFRVAYENHDLFTLQQTTDMDERRINQVKLMFKVYSIIEIDTEVQAISNEGASAKILITKLIDKNGKNVKPSPIIRETIVEIPKEGDRWGKIQW